MNWTRLDAFNVRATQIIALLGLASLLVVAIATLTDVAARWLFSAPIAGVYDLSTLFISVAMAACFPAAIAQRKNISVSFFADLMPVRVRLAFDVIAEVMTFSFFGLLAWQLVIYTGELMESGETSFILEVPIAPWWVVASGLFILCVPVQAVVVCIALRSLITGRPAPSVQSQGEN